MSLLLPQSVMMDEIRRLALVEADHILDERRYWNPRLEDIDHRLSLNKARPHAMGPGIFPGMWHIIRTAEGAPFTAWVISANGLGIPGGYREMADDILETLKRGDMWDKARMLEQQRAVERTAASKDRSRANHREARREDLALNVKAILNPGVSRASRGVRAKARKKA